MRDTRSCTRRERALALILALLLALLPVPAMAGDLASDLGGGLAAATPDTTPEPTPVPIDMQTADAVIGYLGGKKPALNPVKCREWNLVSVNQLVFEPVVDLDENLKPTPMLANNWERKGKYWRFNLRSGIQFHNGFELTAHDVVESWKALVAAGDKNPYYSRLQRIKAMEATDILTLDVQAVDSSYLTLYAMNFPVMQYSTIGDDMARGTGPYWYIDVDDNGSTRLEVNPLWWKQQPALKSILLKRYSSATAAVQALQTGGITMFSTKSPKTAYCRKLSNLTSLDYPTLTYEMLIPNGRKGLMKNLKARQAVMYAINHATLAANAYLDMAVSTEVPIPPSSWLYESQSAMYYYSPERALKLMNELGWRDMTGDGKLNKKSGVRLKEPSLSIWTYNESTNSIRENAARQIASDLEAIGLNVTVTVKSQEKVRQAIKDGKCDLALIGVNLSEVPYINDLLKSGGRLNFSRYKSAKLDKVLATVDSAGSESAIKKAYSRIQLHIVQNLPILGLLFRTGTVLSTQPIGGITGQRCYDSFNGFEFIEN